MQIYIVYMGSMVYSNVPDPKTFYEDMLSGVIERLVAQFVFFMQNLWLLTTKTYVNNTSYIDKLITKDQ